MKKAKNKSKYTKDYKKVNLILSLIGLVLYIVQLIIVLSIFYLNLIDQLILIIIWELFLASVIILDLYTDYSKLKRHKNGTDPKKTLKHEKDFNTQLNKLMKTSKIF